MRDFTQTEEDLDLLRSVLNLLREARIHSNVTESPLANFPLTEAVRDLDAMLKPADPFETNTRQVSPVLDIAWHAMRATWSHTNISTSPVLAKSFHEGIQAIETRLYGQFWARPPAEEIEEADEDLQIG